MFAKVIPALKLPRPLGAFDYAIPDRYRGLVRSGSWVAVPWRGRTVDGLVTEVSDAPGVTDVAIKDIAGLGALEPLGDDLAALPEWMAERYFVAPGTALRAFLPRTPKTKVLSDLQGADLVQDAKPAAREAVRSLTRYANPAEKLAETLRLVRENAEGGRGAIVITPHIGETAAIADTLEKGLPDVRIIRLSGRTAEAKQRRAWQEILSDGQAVVVGNRPAVFAPVRDLGLILVLESESADLRQYDQNPRYDSREIAAYRAAATDASLVFMSHAPRLEEYVAVMRSESAYIESAGAKKLRSIGASLVDISGNPLGRDNPLSPVAMARARDSLQAGKKVLIFLNRKGSAGALVCGECGQVFRCSRCGIAESFADDRLLCRRCDASRQVPDRCAKCGSVSTRQVGMGTASVARALDREFPDAKVCQHDAESVPSDGSGTLRDNADIHVGTRLLLHDAAEAGYGAEIGCVIAVDTDGLLAHPGFRVMEDAWRTIRLMRDIAGSAGADLLLQTVDPENPKLRRLLDDIDHFMRDELASRSKSGYPPCGNLITVTARESDEPRAERAAQAIRMEAERSLQGAGATVAGPLKPKQPFRDGKWRRVVAIKTAETVPTAVSELLSSLPEDRIIDRNPENI